jgi:hypothetical protein
VTARPSPGHQTGDDSPRHQTGDDSPGHQTGNDKSDKEENQKVAEIIYDDGADLAIIQQRHVAVLGYGSQGHAHALSLRDSGVDVRVGLPEGSKSIEAAESEGLRVTTPREACEESDLIMVLVPDTFSAPCTPSRSRRPWWRATRCSSRTGFPSATG